MTSYFTFGAEHKHPVTDESLEKMYVELNNESTEHDRAEMFNRFGSNWSFQYFARHVIGVERYGLAQLVDLPPMPENPQYVVDATGLCVYVDKEFKLDANSDGETSSDL